MSPLSSQRNFFPHIQGKYSAPYVIMLGFLLFSLLGGLILSLPIASRSGTFTPFIDAWFTAVSAICVTGNITLNTASHWNYFGYTVIIVLIQIGGLGFMTLWTFALMYFGKKLDLRTYKVLLESLNIEDVTQIRPLIRYILRFSFVVQGLGALILATDFIPRLGWAKGLYFAVFHSISAFCNAGFDLFGDSLISFTDKPVIMLTIAALIATGGLGFIVWNDLLSFMKNRKLLWHTKIVLTFTGVLIIGGTLLFGVTENASGVFSELSTPLKWVNYLFLSITPRTAGYANVDYTLLSPAGIFLTIILMFLGASSGSTGGGLKTTTLAVIFIQAFRGIQRQGSVLFKRTIPQVAINKSIFILTSGLLLITCATFILSITETIPAGFGLEYILVEVVSCFSTVGLTMGLTPDLTAIGKIILLALMLIGRVGLLTVFWSANMYRKPSQINYPQGSLMIG